MRRRLVFTAGLSALVMVFAPVVGHASGEDEAFEELLSPSKKLLSAKEEVEVTSAKALKAAAQAREFTSDAQEAEEARDEALRLMRVARQDVKNARRELGDYAAGAYISGGSAATTAASLAQADPSELVSRQNTLSAVAETSTEWVAVLKGAEFQAEFMHDRAEVFAAEAQVAVGRAKGAALVADVLATKAEGLFDDLVAQELEQQEKELEEELRRAKMAALGVTGSSAEHVPLDLVHYGNGRIPVEALTSIGSGHYLWHEAAVAFKALRKAAKADGITIGITDSYRSYEGQVSVAKRKGLYSQGGLAAKPGTSNHGWGTALDLRLDSAAQAWMRSNAYRFGYVEDVPREPWHWHYVGDPFDVDVTEAEE